MVRDNDAAPSTLDGWEGLPSFPTDIPTCSVNKISHAKLLECDVDKLKNLLHSARTTEFVRIDFTSTESGRRFLDGADKMFKLAAKVFDGPAEIKLADSITNNGHSLLGYKGLGDSFVDADGTRDNSEQYWIGCGEIAGEGHSPARTLAHTSDYMSARADRLPKQPTYSLTLTEALDRPIQCPGRPERGIALVNLGDAMVSWSDGEFKSNIHRVIAPPGEQWKWARYSLAYVTRPNHDMPMKPLGRKITVANQDEQYPYFKEWAMRCALAERSDTFKKGHWEKGQGTESKIAVEALS